MAELLDPAWRAEHLSKEEGRAVRDAFNGRTKPQGRPDAGMADSEPYAGGPAHQHPETEIAAYPSFRHLYASPEDLHAFKRDARTWKESAESATQ
jgi:hypothetical protein